MNWIRYVQIPSITSDMFLSFDAGLSGHFDKQRGHDLEPIVVIVFMCFR